ncbi:exodeoxyribonuclease III [Fulvivirgaceae bacterium BMA10]|uniref:Exodeoxyribonuclease III n=1 Tax=Splendidivirga corallicola TaxID=3051826 RepID=A0ABT8KV19_9BACT|nr:exodeoxyribonuclease III [Fulvivirgaceae bacterium BMA10]
MSKTRFISWNVNGIRSVTKKGFLESVNDFKPDILCLQETKAQDGEVLQALDSVSNFEIFVNSAERKGYSGTAILDQQNSITTTYDIGIEEHDKEGRVVTAEYESFYLINVYVPNSGRGLVRLGYRQEWDRDFLAYLKKLEKNKPVIVCGDFNVAHQAMDLANPKSNYNKTAGYTQIEIDGFSNFLNAGFIDTFRYLHPDEVAYSYWSYMFNARTKNIGWRIDYFLVSESLKDRIQSAFILPDYLGSDHCPVGLEMDI